LLFLKRAYTKNDMRSQKINIYEAYILNNKD